MIIDSVFRLVASDNLSKTHAVYDLRFVGLLVALIAVSIVIRRDPTTCVERAHLVRIDGPGLSHFHSIAQVDEILVASFLLFRD